MEEQIAFSLSKCTVFNENKLSKNNLLIREKETEPDFHPEFKGKGYRTIPRWTIASGKLPRTTDPWTIPPDNSHLGLFYYPRIITPGQLLPRAMITTNYKFFMTIFCFCFFLPNYIIFVFYYDNKNNNDNSNKTWSLKFLSVMIL